MMFELSVLLVWIQASWSWDIEVYMGTAVAGVVTVSINAVAFREEFKGIFKMITGLFKKKKSE